MNTITENDMNIAIRFVRELVHKGFIKNVIRPNGNYKTAYDWYQEYEDGLSYKVFTGAERICFVSDKVDWVIKTDLYSEDHRTEVERENYIKAEDSGLDMYFAEIHKLITIDGVDFYIQRKAKIDEDKNENSMYDYMSEEITREEFDSDEDYEYALSDSICEMDTEDRIRCMVGRALYLEELIQFTYDNHINDLHAGNWGEIEGEMVITDFAGFQVIKFNIDNYQNL